MSISVDVAEPEEVVSLISQSAEVEVLPLNLQGFADYCFTSAEGVSISIEREGVSACLSNPAQIEDEIRRHLQPEGRMLIIVEGVPIPTPDGTAVCELIGTYLRTSWLSKTHYEALIAWLWQLKENGIDTIQTMNWQQSATAIISVYNNCQKPEHKTFKRDFRPLIAWQTNPLVSSLMGLTDAGLGEKKARQLAESFHTLQAIANAEEVELISVVGKATTAKLLKAMGR